MMVFEDVEGLNLVFGRRFDYSLFVSVVVPTMGEKALIPDSMMVESVLEVVGTLVPLVS